MTRLQKRYRGGRRPYSTPLSTTLAIEACDADDGGKNHQCKQNISDQYAGLHYPLL